MSTSRRSSRLANKIAGTSKNPPKNPNPPRRPRAKKASKPAEPPEWLYLRISRRFLNLLPVATADQPDPQPLPPPADTTGRLTVIRASLQDLRPFAGDTVDWLIRVARLIFEPLGTSSLFTFRVDTLESWLDRDMDPALWRRVEQGEPLRATVYEFRPDNNVFITLSKVSLRQGTSVTTNTSQPQATAFRNTIRGRDKGCIITQNSFDHIVTASRLIPKRLGDAAVTSVVQHFAGSDDVVTRFDPIIGVLLSKHLDSLVDSYQIGFWNSGPDQYVVHSFFHAPLNIYSYPPAPNDTMLHGHLIALPTDNASFPPIGVFNWHYLQCVFTKFATDEYKQIQNIYYFTLPFLTKEDVENDESDFDFDDERNIANPPYPSYLIDLAEARARQRLEDAERNQAIVSWSSGVSIS